MKLKKKLKKLLIQIYLKEVELMKLYSDDEINFMFILV